ncbi:DUF6528 family protein [Paraflavitalea pollutisoli]|uniref:DUF6528 family protein n=1 Tax=Paraflavitalea pollutisoli TaxID=3034143 RepID=UPI0023EAD667|nr:DUF6528 family protein [Paraflavitalea sp. H1-2-19X]
MSFIRRLLSIVLCFVCGAVAYTALAQSAFVPGFKNCRQCLVLSEQSVNRVAILDLAAQRIVWEWLPDQSPAIKPAHVGWFRFPSDAKVVYGGTAILMNASGGGVALIRIADKKVMFYAYAGGNPHSSELLPDGNIVTASSTGNLMTVFRTDTLQFPEKVYSQQRYLEFGHNVVWDNKRQLLWSAAQDKLQTFRYNGDCRQPELIPLDSIPLPQKGAHDLFPVGGKQALWLTNTQATYQYDLRKKALTAISIPWHDVKSVSTGPKNAPVVVVVPDGTPGSWWTNEVRSTDGKIVFKQAGLKIYKARWFIENDFSYPANNPLRICQ